MSERPDILEMLARAPVVFDGAMGTVLYAHGVFINKCYDAVCLSDPRLVLEVHREYVHAGAQVIETNTFGANLIKLGEHGLADQVAAINRGGVELAREAAADSVLVAGSVGPCLHPRQMWKPGREGEIEKAFTVQIGTLVDSGVDLLQLETFCHPEELAVAVRVAARFDCPLLASFTVGDDGKTIYGVPAEKIVVALDDNKAVDMIGLNCGTGPAGLCDVLEGLLSLSGKPFVVMPNAGMPREVDGRLIYMTSPEYFTTYAGNFIKHGVRGVGGCCGTTPAHIKDVAKALRGLSVVSTSVTVPPTFEREVAVAEVPMADKSRFGHRLASGEVATSVELLPPKSCNLDRMLEKAAACKQHGIDAINIPDGPRASARVSPMIAAIEIERQVGIETILHYCCRDRNLIGMQSDLLGGFTAGLRNLLIITGDPPKLGDYPDATGVFDVDAIGLTRVASGLNRGFDLGGNPIAPPTALLIGVGANPCAVVPEIERSRYCQKLEAGAQFAITQPVFDPDALFRFLDEVEARGSRVPIIAGVWPLVSLRNAEFMRNEVPGVEIPDAVVARMAEARTKEDGIKIGIEIACRIRDRIAPRVAGFQVSAPFGRVDVAFAVLGRN